MKLSKLVFVLLALVALSACSSQTKPTSQPKQGDFQGEFTFQNNAGVTLNGHLRLPEGEGPFPLVVLLHGVSGVLPDDHKDAKALVQEGYATAVIDSFKGRDFRYKMSGENDLAKVRPYFRTDDAYGALRKLVTHPKIDHTKTLLLGRSHGGITTLLASTSRAANMFSPNGPRYTAFIALYPPCIANYPEYDQPLAGPLRMHLGAADVLTEAKPCAALAERMQAKGFDVKYQIYENAHHGFDMSYPMMRIKKYDNYASCRFELAGIDAPLPPLEEWNKCKTQGTMFGKNADAKKAYTAARNAQLKALLVE